MNSSAQQNGENMFKEILQLQSSWDFLKSTSLPIAVYGTGNGADRVFDEFGRLGIEVSAVIASDGFVRNRTFHGFQVKSVSQAEAEFGDFVIALCFASPLPQVIESIKALSAKHRVIMPSVPVYADSIFNKDFLQSNLESIEKAYSLLSDEQSKNVFESIIRFQITGDLSFCFDCESTKDEAFEILGLGENESFLDLGAYRGDTIEEFLHYTKSHRKIVAVEPDKRSFRKLKENCEKTDNCIVLNNAVWSTDTFLKFSGNKGRGASTNEKGEEIFAICVDSIFKEYGSFTYINADVEGAESQMLLGAVHALQAKPKLCIAAYHRSEDIFELINKINAINPCYEIYLRHHPHISFWETNLYCR